MCVEELLVIGVVGGLQLDMLIDDRYTTRVVHTRIKTTTQEDEYQIFIAVMNKVSPYRLVGQHFIDVCTQYREQCLTRNANTGKTTEVWLCKLCSVLVEKNDKKKRYWCRKCNVMIHSECFYE